MWKASAHKYYQIFHPDIKSRNIGVHFCKILCLFIIFAVYVGKVYLIYCSANVVEWMSSCSKGTVRRLMQCERSGILHCICSCLRSRSTSAVIVSQGFVQNESLDSLGKEIVFLPAVLLLVSGYISKSLTCLQ